MKHSWSVGVLWRNEVHSAWKPHWLHSAAPRLGKLVSSRWLQAPGTHFWSLTLSSSPVFSLLITQRGGGAGRGWCVGTKHDDKFCWRTFSGRSRQLSPASYFRHVWYLCFFSIPQFPGGKELAYAEFQNTLMRRTLLWGSHYCEHLWTVEFNWATANVYCVWKE